MVAKKVALLAAARTVSVLTGQCSQPAGLRDWSSCSTRDAGAEGFQGHPDQVVKAIGNHSLKIEVGGKEIWKYEYNLITAIPLRRQERS